MHKHFGPAVLDEIYNTPEWLAIPIFVMAALVLSVLGLWVVYRTTSREDRRRHGRLAEFIVTNVAVIYAVLLAFIAVATWESYTKATELAETEANLAGNLYRDTAGLPEPVKVEVRAEVLRYLRFVVYQEWPAQKAGREVQGGWKPLEAIHRSVAAMQPGTAGQAVLMEEMLRSLNAIYDARRSRLNALDGNIPDLVWIVIVVLGALTIGYTCFVDAEGFWIHTTMLAGLTLTIALVIALIVELDYPFRGTISVGPDAYARILAGLPLVQ